MTNWLTQNEVLYIVQEFSTSNCNRFELTKGSIHIELNRVHESPAVVSIASPSVGIFYAAPEQGAPPFVHPGDRVMDGTVIGIIKVLQEVRWVQARVGGIVTEVCAEEGQFVEYGQPLFRIQTVEGVKI